VPNTLPVRPVLPHRVERPLLDRFDDIFQKLVSGTPSKNCGDGHKRISPLLRAAKRKSKIKAEEIGDPSS
jgi:hypothetical protein